MQQTEFPGVYIIEPKVFRDHRGFFMESYNAQIFLTHGIEIDFMQDNHALSAEKGVLRGLHFQTPPYTQTKLVRVTRGSVYDVVVDIRVGSPTYGKWLGVTLSADNFLQLLVPKGFAHGYVTLEENTEFLYKVDTPYAAQNDAGISWNDPDLGIDWPESTPILSDKDAKLPFLRDYQSPFTFEK